MTTPRIIRVFPRRTKATPTDALAYFGPPDRVAEADEVHVSVTFTYDKAFAEHLAEQWKHVAPVKIGGGAGARGAVGFARCGSAIRCRACCRSSMAGTFSTIICSPARVITLRRSS
jgi:hypothetical protein